MTFPLWLTGCLISLGGSLGAIFGTNVQKLSFRKNEVLPISQRRVYYKQALWLAGLFLVALGGVTDFVSLAMAPQSTIAALGSVSLAANVFLAHFWLGEAIAARDYLGTALIVIGSTLSVVFGDHSDTSYSISELQDLYSQFAYIIYGSITMGSLIIMYLLCRLKLTPLRCSLVEAIDAWNTLQVEANLAEAAQVRDRFLSEASSLSSKSLSSNKSLLSNQDPNSMSSAERSKSSDLLTRDPSHSSNLLHRERSLSPSKMISAAASGVAEDQVLAASVLPQSPPKQKPHSHESVKYPILDSITGPTANGYGSLSNDDEALHSPLLVSAPPILVSDHAGAADALPSSTLEFGSSLLSARERVLELESQYQPWSRLHPVFYCAISGIFGAQSLLFGKSVAELFSTSMSSDGSNQFTQGMTYVFIAALAVCLVGQLHFFASALEFFDALFCVPVFKCFFLMLSTIGGALYFQEFSCFDQEQWIIFPIGVVLNLAGVYVLSSRNMGVSTAAVEGEEGATPLTDLSLVDDTVGAQNDLIRRLSHAAKSDVDSQLSDQAQAQLLAEASEQLLRSAVEIAKEEEEPQEESTVGPLISPAHAGPRKRALGHRTSSAGERVMLVTSPMDGVVLVASPSCYPPTNHPSLPLERNLTSPSALSRAPTLPLIHAVGDGATFPTSHSFGVGAGGAGETLTATHLDLGAESAPPITTISITGPSDDASLYPALPSSSNASLHPRTMSVFSPSGLAADGMEVNMFSLGANSGYDFLRAPTSNGPSRASSVSAFSSPQFGSALKRFQSEVTPTVANGSNLQIPPVINGANTNRGSISTLRSSATFTKPPSTNRSSVSSTSRGHRKASDVLVQRGSLIYRTTTTANGATSATPLDASLDPASEVSSLTDRMAVFLTPGSASSFTVQSPLTKAEYSMPRRSSIFSHTRGYLQRLSAAALGGGASGMISNNGMITSPPNGTSPSSPQRGYTAPNVRLPGVLPDSSVFSPPQQTFSDIGPADRIAAMHTGSYHVNSMVQSPQPVYQLHGGHDWTAQQPSDHLTSAHLHPPTTDSPVTPASTYIPNDFLSQPLGGGQLQPKAESNNST